MRRHRGTLVVSLLSGSLLLSACGSGDAGPTSTLPTPLTSTGTTTGTTTSPATSPAGAGLPDLEVVRVGADGQKAQLRTLSVAGKPTLLWFWAPHCLFCRREAPDLIAFERQHGDRVTVLGLGAQDNAQQAESFVEETSTEGLTMVWDRTGRSWVHFDVTNQPTVVLLGADGKVKKTWFRDFDTDEILQAAKA